jgi:curved DNA-binding protein CbpA
VSTRTWLATDYYELLGVERDASTEEIARAFRTTAKDHHPDRTGDAEARERFMALSEAYGVLGKPERRARYDELRAEPGDARAQIRGDARPPSKPRRAAPIEPDADRPLSVRALPQRRHGRWASIGGTVVLAVGLAAAGLVAWLFADGSGTTDNGSDPFGRNITLALVAVKLVVVGIVFLVLGNRRRRHP